MILVAATVVATETRTAILAVAATAAEATVAALAVVMEVTGCPTSARG